MRGEICHFDNVPEWCGTVDANWKYRVRTFIQSRNGKRFIDHQRACEVAQKNEDCFSVWCREGHDYHRFETFEMADGFVNTYDSMYRRTAYLKEVPEGVAHCKSCFGAKEWAAAVKKLDIRFDYQDSIENIEQLNEMEKYESCNRYLLALRDIYKSTYELTFNASTVKTLNRKKYMRGNAEHVVREFLQLGVILIQPEPTGVMRVVYNTQVDISTTLEVLTWYGKEKNKSQIHSDNRD